MNIRTGKSKLLIGLVASLTVLLMIAAPVIVSGQASDPTATPTTGTPPDAAADTSSAPPCTPDFTAVRDLLLQAETSSAAGDNDGILTALRDAQAQLGVVIQACTVVEFTEDLSARGGQLTMKYPKDWSQSITADNFDSASPTYIQFGNRASVFNSTQSPIPVLNPGDQLIAVIFGTSQALVSGSEEATPSAAGILQGVLNSIQQSDTNSGFTFGEIETLSINDRRAARVAFSGGSFDAVAYSIEFFDASYFAVVLSLSAPGEMGVLDPITLELAKSVRFDPSPVLTESTPGTEEAGATAEIVPTLAALPTVTALPSSTP